VTPCRSRPSAGTRTSDRARLVRKGIPHIVNPSLQLVVPAFNESARLPSTLELLATWLRDNAPAWGPVEVVVVDNASTDGTADVALGLTTPQLPITVMECPRPGKGAAVRAGMLTTTADLVGFVDADGATSFEALATAVSLITGGADVAIGSRAVTGSVTMTRHSALRERGAAVYRWSTGRLVPGIRDTQCGFKIFRGALARAVWAHTRIDGFAFDVEVLGQARLRGATIAEFPVTWVDVPGSTFSPARHGVESFRELAAIGLILRRASRTASVTSLTPLVRSVLPEPPVADLALDA
jgi:dolichyl-phosphate beta-glucosyltransferase